MKHALFICGKAKMRSPTAADIAATWDGVSTDFAGLSNDADERLSLEHIRWADMIFVMEARQKKRLMDLFANDVKDKKIVVLNIPDRFKYMDPDLVNRLSRVLRPHLTS